MRIKNLTTGLTVSSNVETADTFSTRLFGLIPRKSLGGEEGLWLTPCTMIHMCFMSFAIDAVFVDKALNVVYLIQDFKPWQFSKYVGNAIGVIELPAGHTKGRINIGDKLEFTK